MYISILIRLILGYVRVEIEGYYIEKFINICLDKKILIWKLKRKTGVTLYFNIGIKDYKKLKEICRKTNCKIKIRSKKGLPFFLHKYKKRKIFLIVLIVISIVIYASSKYVWNIQIEIEENKTLENINRDLSELGIKRGMKKNEIDTNKIITEIRLKRNDISWMGIDIKGTNVIVKIVKADDKPKILDKNEYCNIVATKTGVVESIVAQNGTPLVKVGDTVQKGDILIAGYMEGKYTEKRYVHSMRRDKGKNKLCR